VSPVAYQLDLPPAWTIHDVFHASLLTPYHEMAEHGVNYMRPPQELIEDAEEYQVEAIINYHLYGNKRHLQYLIKWKGYPDSDNTWEPADQVHMPALIMVYHQKNPLDAETGDKRGWGKQGKVIRSLKVKAFIKQTSH
jgi:Chromo (CHRromatin Organisation MOdifier) domain